MLRSPDAVILIGLFLASLTLHMLTSARTVTFSDSGDFLMALHTVGNCHGPGYPLYLMTAKLFTLAFPFGSLAFRASLYSGIFASFTSCLIYWIVLKISKSRTGGILAAAAFCFSYTFWYQSVIPETYSLNAFFIALLIVLALRWVKLVSEGNRRSADNTLCAFAFCYGLALTNHFTILFLLPAFLLLALQTDWRQALAPRNLLRIAAFFALGLLPYLYQPAAAFRGPAYNYGDPATLTNWLKHMSVYYQRSGLLEYPWAMLPRRFWSFFGTLNTEFPYAAWLGAVGFASSFRRRNRRYAFFLLALFLLSLLPVMTYSQYESVLRAHFYYPAYLFFALWMGLGAATVVEVCGRLAGQGKIVTRNFATSTAALALVALVTVSSFVHYGYVDKSRYTYARDAAKRMLDSTEPGSIVIAETDNLVFPCLYLQIVEKSRPDVRVINPISVWAPGYHGKDLVLRSTPGYSPGPGETNYEQIVERNFSDSVVYTAYPLFSRKDWDMMWQGSLVRLRPRDTQPEETEPGVEETFSTGNLDKTPSAGLRRLDTDARESVAMPALLRASAEYSRGELGAASNTLRAATGFFTRDLYVPTLYSCMTFSIMYQVLGEILNAQREFDETVSLLPHARAIDPDFASIELARAFARTGDYDAALAELDLLLAYKPDYADAIREKGQILILLSETESGIQALEEAVRLNQDDAEAHFYLGLAYRQEGDNSKALKQFEITVGRAPDSKWAQNARSLIDELNRKAEEQP